MTEETITLDFKNNGAMTLDDISFGPPEEIEDSTSKKPIAPIVPEDNELEQEEENSNQEQKPVASAPTAPAAPLPTVTLEDLSFDGISNEEEGKENEAPEIKDDLKLAAIRAVINKKLERHNLEAEVNLEDLTEEQLVDFEEEVDNTILDSKYSKVKSVDSRIEAVLNYIEAGGDPAKITSLFRERESIDSIDISNKEGQISLIKSYYKNVKGLESADITKRLDKLEAVELLEEEAKDIKKEYDAHNDEKIAQEQEKQKEIADRKAQNEARKRVILEKAFKDNNVSLKLKADLERIAFGSGTLPSGETMKVMDYKILEMQANPESFYKLSLFLADPAEYEKAIIQGSKNKEVTKEMKKGFNIETKPKAGVEKIENQAPEKTKVKFNF